jgi:RNA polymerase sigma-70 factor (ECF subfamily)
MQEVVDRFNSDLIKFLPDLHLFAIRLAGNALEAEEIIQDTWLTALAKRSEFQEGSNMRAWLTSIQFQCYRQARKKLAVRMSRETCDDEASEAYPQLPNQYDSVLFQEVGDLIEKLPIEQKEAIYYTIFDGLSYKEAAMKLDCSEGTVKSRISRARTALLEMMESAELQPAMAMKV